MKGSVPVFCTLNVRPTFFFSLNLSFFLKKMREEEKEKEVEKPVIKQFFCRPEYIHLNVKLIVFTKLTTTNISIVIRIDGD